MDIGLDIKDHEEARTARLKLHEIRILCSVMEMREAAETPPVLYGLLCHDQLRISPDRVYTAAAGPVFAIIVLVRSSRSAPMRPKRGRRR
jgi:hypothetical protein